MSAPIRPKICGYCGRTFLLSGGRRYKYCSDECALQAHRKQCRETFRRRYALMRDVERQRYRDREARNPGYRHEYYLRSKEKLQGKKK